MEKMNHVIVYAILDIPWNEVSLMGQCLAPLFSEITAKNIDISEFLLNSQEIQVSIQIKTAYKIILLK